MTLSIRDVIAQVKTPESVFMLCLRGDLDAEYRDLERRLPDASNAAESLGDTSDAGQLRQRMADVAGEMVAATVAFRLRAMPAFAWSDLFARKPDVPKPVEGADRVDDEAAAEFRAVWRAWLCELLAGTCYDPAMTVEDAADLAGAISFQQWDELTDAAWERNTDKQQIPFSVAAFANPPATTPKSKRRTNSASRAASSSAGS